MSARSYITSLGAVLAVVAIPWIELFSIHDMVRSVLGPNNVVMGFYSRDIWAPSFCALVLGLFHLHSQRPFRWDVQPITFTLNVALFSLLASLLLHYDQAVVRWGNFLATSLLCGGTLLLLTTSLGVLIDGKELLRRLRQHGNRLFYLVLAWLLLFTYPYLLAWFWPPLVNATGYSVYYTLMALGFQVTQFGVGGTIGIIHPSMRVSIGMGCSGLEGIFFFLFAYCLYQLFANPGWRYRTIAGLAVVGSTFLFTLNVVRIVLFFSVAVLMNELTKSANGNRFFVWAFHENVGWLLYAAGLFLFFHLVSSEGIRKRLRWSATERGS